MPARTPTWPSSSARSSVEKVRERKLDRLYEEIERPLIELLAQMEIWGVRVDPAVLRAMSQELQAELQRLEKEIHELAGGAFNINSPRQLGDILFHKLGLPATKKTRVTKGFSTSLDILEELAVLHPLARLVLDYRQKTKLKIDLRRRPPGAHRPGNGKDPYFLQPDRGLHRPALVELDPNLQNIPARGEWGQRFRRAFIPDKGHRLLAADYSQIELRILAHLSEDPALIETFLDGPGRP